MTTSERTDFSDPRNFLPASYEYAFIQIPNEETVLQFRCNIYDEDQIKDWLAEFMSASLTTFKIRRKHADGLFVRFKVDYRCHHNTRRPPTAERTSKNTLCPATLHFAIHNYLKKSKRSAAKDPSLLRLPCLVTFRRQHNHTIASTEILRFRPLCEDVKRKLIDFFHNGHTPSVALEMLKAEIITKHRDDYARYASDGHHLPSLSMVYRLYHKEFKIKENDNLGDSLIETIPQDTHYTSAADYNTFSTDNKQIEVTTKNIEPIVNKIAVSEELSNHSSQKDNVPNDSCSLDKVRAYKEKLNEFVQRIHNCLDCDPLVFVPAVHKMLDNIDNFCKSDDELSNALCTFGEKHIIEELEDNPAQKERKMPLNPTYIAGRKLRRILPAVNKNAVFTALQFHDYTNISLSCPMQFNDLSSYSENK